MVTADGQHDAVARRGLSQRHGARVLDPDEPAAAHRDDHEPYQDPGPPPQPSSLLRAGLGNAVACAHSSCSRPRRQEYGDGRLQQRIPHPVRPLTGPPVGAPLAIPLRVEVGDSGGAAAETPPRRVEVGDGLRQLGELLRREPLRAHVGGKARGPRPRASTCRRETASPAANALTRVLRRCPKPAWMTVRNAPVRRRAKVPAAAARTPPDDESTLGWG